MLIGIDASRANRKKKTGVEWYSYHLVRAMKKVADPEDRFVLYSRKSLSGELGELPVNFESRVLAWPPGKLWTHVRLSWEMAMHAPDLLFVPAHTLPYVHAKKTVVTCHDVGFEVFPELYYKGELERQRWAMKFHLEHASRIIAVSEFTKKEIVRIYGADPDRISAIPIAYDDDLYRPVGDGQKIQDAMRKYGIEGHYIFYIGRLEKKKNTLNLLKAFRRLVSGSYLQTSLVLAGSPGYGHEDIEDYVREYGLQENVIMPGWVQEEDAPALISGADLFVFPSLYEGFGIPLLQAMACGTPVAASDAASIPEVAGGAALLFNPGNPDDMAAAMDSLLTDEDLRRSLIAKGLRRAAQFSWTRCARETLEVLKGLE